MLSIFKLNKICYSIENNNHIISSISSNYLNILRCKGKDSKKSTEIDTQTEESTDVFDDAFTDKSTKLMNVHVNSLRTDALVKAGLGIARNKIETLFYESKIRVNGQKIFKKSAQVNVGDEIDVIKGTNPNNPNFLTVARVEILSATNKGETINVKLRRCKTLTIDNYEDKWKS